MKEKNKLQLILLMCLFSCFSLLSGCSSIEFNIEDTIKAPVNENASIHGTWKIEKYISLETEQDPSQEIYVGREAIFDNEVGAIGSDVCINPKYKVISTYADTFVHNRYRISNETLELPEEKVNVVTITTDNQLFYQLILMDETSAYVYVKDGFLVIRKLSNKVDETIKKSSLANVGMNLENGEYKEDILLRSGVLIGIRDKDNRYRTLWIYSKNREIKTVSTRNQLLVPRAKGFWEVGTIKNESENEDFFAEPFSVDLKELSQNSKTERMLTKKPGAQIVFVGNDYIGIEYNSRFSVLPIDNISEGKGISFSDIIDNSNNLFKQASSGFISKLNNSKAKNIIKEPDEENFTLKRRNGHWIISSRLYYKETFKEEKYEDFDINTMVPSGLICYDEMTIPWNEIKSKLPWITDAYMSPNKDIAILVSNDSLSIYPIVNKSIINNRLLKIPLSEADEIIMTEWSLGRLADVWANLADKIFVQGQFSSIN